MIQTYTVVRHTQDEKFISLLNGLIHLEQHRFPCESTRKFDDSILQAVRRLHWVAIEVDRVTNLGPGVLLVDQLTQQLQSLSMDAPFQAARDMLLQVVRQLPAAITLLDELEDPIASVISLAEDFPEAHKILKRTQVGVLTVILMIAKYLVAVNF